MKIPNHRQSFNQRESGQAAVLVALVLFLGFLAFAALAIDGGMTYLVRRDLQNVADSAALAACRVIAQNDTSGGYTIATNALDAAQNSVTAHLGAWEPYVTPQMGTGVGLVKGIEISPTVSPREVRVAVQRRVPTVLTQFLGRGDSIMLAQAHCDSRAGGGLLPIAVPRYLTSKDKMSPSNPAYTDFLARPGSPLYPSDSITVTWTGRYGNFLVPLPCGNPGAPACAGNVSYVAGESAVAGIPDANSGPKAEIVGQNAQTNSGTANFRNFVMLDIRNVGPQNPLEYYNGVSSQANAAKDVSQYWIYQHGYPGPMPQVGSEVAILAGTSNNFTAKTVVEDAGYQVGDIIATIVYDGYVWKRPDFSLSVNPVSGNGIIGSCGSSCPTDTAPIAYTVKIDKAGSTAWGTAPAFTLNFNFSNAPLPPGSQVSITPLTPAPGTPIGLSAPDYTYSIPSVSQSGWTGQLTIWNTEALTRTPYLTGINAYANSSLNTHGLNTDNKNASANVQFGFWSGSNVSIGYTARSDAGFATMVQGGSGDANLLVYGVGASFPNKGKCANIPVTGSVYGNGANWNTIFSSNSAVGTIDVVNGTESTLSPKLTVKATAPIATGYTLRYTISSFTCNGITVPQNIVDIPMQVIADPVTNGTPDSFVIIQGFSLFRISGWDSNDVFGYAVSGLYPNLDDITIGLRARLVPWN